MRKLITAIIRIRMRKLPIMFLLALRDNMIANNHKIVKPQRIHFKRRSKENRKENKNFYKKL